MVLDRPDSVTKDLSTWEGARNNPHYEMRQRDDMRGAVNPLLITRAYDGHPRRSRKPFDSSALKVATGNEMGPGGSFAEMDIFKRYDHTDSWREEFIALRRRLASARSAHPLGSLPPIRARRNQNDGAVRQKILRHDRPYLLPEGESLPRQKDGLRSISTVQDLVRRSIREVVNAARRRGFQLSK